MKIKYIAIAAIGCLMGLSACVEDKGSYDYLDINEVSTEGLESSYSVMASTGLLEIRPTVTGTILGDDDSQYEYTWYACQSEIATDNHTHTVLGHEKDLVTTVELNPGTYDLYLLINDNSTGQEWIISGMTLSVTTPMATGFYVFGDNPDGTVGMDFLSMPGNGGGDTAIIENIFVNSQQIRGAENLYYRGYSTRPGYNPTFHDLWAITESGSYKIECSVQSQSTFDIDPTYEEDLMFFSTIMSRPIKVLDAFPHQFSNGASAFNPLYRGYVTEDAIVCYSFYSAPESYQNPVNRYSASSTEYFTPYKNIFCVTEGTSIPGYMTYDMDNDRFTTLSGSLLSIISNCRQLTDNDANDPFPWNQNGRTIVYGTNSGYYSYAIMKDKDNDTNFYLYEMYVSSYLSPRKVSAYSFTTAEAPEFDRASHYAITYSVEDYTILLYAVDNKLYQFNYATKQATLVETFDGEITFLEYNRKLPTTEAYPNSRFLVCTYNEAADPEERGTIYEYTMGQTLELTPVMSGPELDVPFVYHTSLKVAKLEYRNSSL